MDDKLLFDLTNENGPSGYEYKIRHMIQTQIEKFVDEVFVDKMGNLIAHKKGKGPRVMLAAHMDEVGLMVTHIEDNGKIRLSTIGGVEIITLIAQKVDIITSKGEIHGVISYNGLSGDELLEEIPELNELFVDTGLDKKELEQMGVGIGNYIIPVNQTGYLGSKSYVAGKAMDDRAGCFVLINVIKDLFNKKVPLDLFFVFTVQEEIGLYGAQTSLYNIDPEWGIAVDVTNYEIKDDKVKCGVGCGPILVIKDAEIIINSCLNENLKSLAKKNNIPLQLKVEEYGSTDAAKMMLHKGGLPAAIIGIPIKNIHSPISFVSMKDIKQVCELIEELLINPPKSCIL